MDPAEVADVSALARTAGDTDGADPFDESVLLRLRDPQAATVHLTARTAAGELVGYAHLDVTTPAEGIGLDLVVHPAHRRRGLGRSLAVAALTEADRAGTTLTGPDRDGAVPVGPAGTDADRDGAVVRSWAHGDHPAAAALAVDLGLTRARVLWQLRRPLTEPTAAPPLPDGVTLRAFRPGSDDDAWLALNARAFADHPEQGRWTVADLRARLAEPWFDPAGFLLAVQESTGRLLGFHWTKVHDRPGTHPVGEVYVLGVDPTAHGGGLGRALTAAGLTYLRRQRGLDRVMLYVDESNTAAVALYRRAGFAHWCAHVNYQRG
ncbi:mycothiol synthase [Micromonospora cathayae]|uniref:Mycothiol acetyltransferase n=2 Tax=Micromonospora cathayae TaxID=3028804 RepID=A0ABY7ZY09_9ACTN|nr:mycothiol synthase [Micromonospora sp. HUAS 3]WDZ87917.1 mycothiol synthase [Micromonospora sp. HUAS 3]